MTRPSPITHDHYTVLSLPFTTSSTISKQQLKLAYHRTLLRHHPDKTSSAKDQTASTKQTPEHNGDDHPTYSIDEITLAYKTLSDPSLRAEYDRSLRLDRLKIVEREKTGAVFHTGLEVVDLEDLAFEEKENDKCFWYRACRCGDEQGFTVTEEDLEREAEHGEILIGCRGCSLWMKILFAVEDGADDGGQGDDHDGDDEVKGETEQKT